MRKTINWDVLKEMKKIKKEKQELEAEVAIMRDALIQALYALEWLDENPGEWDEHTERALASVTWVLTSDAGHEFLDSYVRMQKALLTMKAAEMIGNIEIPENNKDLH